MWFLSEILNKACLEALEYGMFYPQHLELLLLKQI